MSSVFDPGKKDRDTAANLAQQGIIKGGTVSGPGGISSSFNFANGQGSSTSSLGSFQGSMDSMQALTQQLLGQAGGGIPDELRALGNQSIARLGNIDVNRLQNQQDFQGLGQIFQSAMGTASADPFELGSGISEKLRALSERRNQRLVNKKFDQLNSKGQLGTSGGAGAMGELDANLFDQGLKFDLAGADFGRNMQQDAFGRALGASQGREQIGARQFGEEMGVEQLGGQRALQQFGVGSDMFSQWMNQQMQGTQLGLATNASAMATSQLPLAFQQAMMNMSGQSSNSLFAAAGINQQNAAMAKSPFMEALNAAGGFMGAVTGTGMIGGLAGAAAGGASSDMRLKENIVQVGTVDNVHLYTWDWNSLAEAKGLTGSSFGVLAQEVRETHPDSVGVDSDGYLTVNYQSIFGEL